MVTDQVCGHSLSDLSQPDTRSQLSYSPIYLSKTVINSYPQSAGFRPLSAAVASLCRNSMNISKSVICVLSWLTR